MNKKTIENIDVAGKKVLARVDFNVPQDETGAITDDTRIRAALPTIQYLLDHDAKLILCAHLGRPKGQVNPKYSLAPIAARLSELLGKPVKLAADVVGESAQALTAAMKEGDIVMLENIRFEPGETKNDPEFTAKLAALAEIYVNDAFGAAHRAHSSTAGVAEYLPAVAGYLLGKEIDIMGKALEDPARPFVAILGGAKIKDKLGVIENLLDKVDTLIIGGGMSYTFQKALGGHIGKSLLDEERIEFCQQMIALAKKKGVKLLLPVDNEASQEFNNDAMHATFHSREIPDGWEGLDIGPKTRELFAAELRTAKTVVWNGPMGVCELSTYAVGTDAIAKTLAGLEDAVTIIGGGDSAAAVKKLGYGDKMTHISTGGGASLEFLEGKELPGVACLNDKEPPVRRPIIAGNWKMNMTPATAKALVTDLIPMVADAQCDVVVCPPFVCLETVKALVEGTNIGIGAQNCYVKDAGAYTGEVSPATLEEMGIQYVILGHSERRAYFGETDEFINEKVKAVLAHNMIPILCVGETLEQREAGVTETLMRYQTVAALSGLTAEQVQKVVIAYEPVWAIGTGLTATADQAEEVIAFIRDQICKTYGEETAEAIRIQYGGSMKPTNASELMAQKDIDGGLIGGASLKAADFSGIVHF